MKTPGIIVALDGMEVNEALYMARLLSGMVWGFKINDLLLEAGTSIIPRLSRYGYVFCDPKLHDTPQTVANSVEKLARAGAHMISIHASGDIRMITAAVKRRRHSKIVGISTLTSHERLSRARILKAAYNIVIAQADGIVLPTRALPILRNPPEFKNLLRLTPGIRPGWWQDKNDDQKLSATPKEATLAGSDFLIIGRPIALAEDPAAAAGKIIDEITAKIQ